MHYTSPFMIFNKNLCYTQSMKNPLQSNIWKLYIGQFLTELIFFIPIFVPFLGGLGFSMQQILLLEAAFALALTILEIPSGYFADIYGRKTAITLGSFIQVSGMLIFVLATTFGGFLLGELIIGIGGSLVSGAGEALLYDSLIELKREKDYKKITGNLFFCGRMAAVTSSAIGALLATIFLRLPFYATLLPYTIWMLVNFTLHEPRSHKKPFEKWAHFIRILRESFHNQKLKYFILYAAIPPAFFLMSFFLYQRYLEFIGLPLFYFGFVVAGMNIISGMGSKYAEKIEAWISPKGSLLLIPALAIGAWLILGSAKSLWFIPLLFLTSGIWGFTSPIFQDFIQKITTSDRRATVLSIQSFLTRGIFLILAPFLGWITDLYDVQTALLMAAALLFILSGLSLIMLKRIKIL